MDITPDALDWDSNDTINLRNFLKTQTGTRLLPKIAEGFPLLLASGESNAILIRSGEVRGMQDVLKSILALAYPPAEVKQSNDNYPDLTNDEAWKDGNNIKTPNA
jgi:hypothetical protein